MTRPRTRCSAAAQSLAAALLAAAATPALAASLDVEIDALASAEGKVMVEKYTGEGVEMQCVLPKRWESKFAPFAATALAATT